MKELGLNESKVLRMKEELSTSASQIVKKTDSFFSKVVTGKQYNLKRDKKLRSEIYDVHITLTEVQSTLRQLRELGYRIPDYLANQILIGKIQSRQSYATTKSRLLQRFDVAGESLSDYDVFQKLYEKSCKPCLLEMILPFQFYCYEIADRIAKQEINSAKEFRASVKSVQENPSWNTAIFSLNSEIL